MRKICPLFMALFFIPLPVYALTGGELKRLNAEVKEAEARTFADLVQENNVTGRKNRDWLYSMVCLNMAYLQFGGGPNPQASDLNKLIRQKLRGYLPAGTLKKLASAYSLE